MNNTSMYAKIENERITEFFPNNNKEGTWILVENYDMYSEYTYNASTNTVEKSGQVVLPEPSQEELDAAFRQWNMDLIRETRNKLLLESDWTQGQDSPLSDEKKTEWRTYRQALRDIPDSNTNYNEVVWPDKP